MDNHGKHFLFMDVPFSSALDAKGAWNRDLLQAAMNPAAPARLRRVGESPRRKSSACRAFLWICLLAEAFRPSPFSGLPVKLRWRFSAENTEKFHQRRHVTDTDVVSGRFQSWHM